MKITKTPIKFHMEGNQLVIDEVYDINGGSALVIDSTVEWPTMTNRNVTAVFLQNVDMEGKWTITVNGVPV